MARTNIGIDEAACRAVMKRYGLMFSAYRRKVLAVLLLRPDEGLHVRELERLTGVPAVRCTERNKDRFLKRILDEPKLYVIGDAASLEKPR